MPIPTCETLELSIAGPVRIAAFCIGMHWRRSWLTSFRSFSLERRRCEHWKCNLYVSIWLYLLASSKLFCLVATSVDDSSSPSLGGLIWIGRKYKQCLLTKKYSYSNWQSVLIASLWLNGYQLVRTTPVGVFIRSADKHMRGACYAHSKIIRDDRQFFHCQCQIYLPFKPPDNRLRMGWGGGAQSNVIPIAISHLIYWSSDQTRVTNICI